MMFNQNKKEKENMAINQLGLALDQFLHERVEEIFNPSYWVNPSLDKGYPAREAEPV